MVRSDDPLSAAEDHAPKRASMDAAVFVSKPRTRRGSVMQLLDDMPTEAEGERGAPVGTVMRRKKNENASVCRHHHAAR
jgi:hypothetical protein